MNNFNCEPGDIARCVGGPKSYGRIVQCLGLVAAKVVYVESRCGTMVEHHTTGPTWHIDGWLVYRMTDGQVLELPVGADRELRPLRKPGDEEADLLLAPLPFDVARAEHELALQGMPS